MPFDISWDATWTTGGGGGGGGGSGGLTDDARLAETWARRDGTGVGPTVTPSTSLATWIAATAGASLSGSKVTVSGNGVIADGVIFGDVELDVTGDDFTMQNCSVGCGPNAGAGEQANILLTGANPTLQNNVFTNGTTNCAYIKTASSTVTATGVITIADNDFVNMKGDDPIKGPNTGGHLLMVLRNRLKGFIFGPASHLDMVDFRAAAPGSTVRGNIIICDIVSFTGTPGGGNGINNMCRCATSDGHGGTGAGCIMEDNIFVGLSVVAGGAAMMQPNTTNVLNTGVKVYNNAYELRNHGAFWYGENGSGVVYADDFYNRKFDYTASQAGAGTLVFVSELTYPDLAQIPADVPTQMAKPTITDGAASGDLDWADNERPWNRRQKITQIDLRWSTNGSTWNEVPDVSLLADTLSGLTPGAGYRVQFRARNAIGIGAWSPSSDIIAIT